MKKDINSYLKEKRIDKRISCRGLSRLSGMSHTTVNDIENNKNRPSIISLIKICNALEIDVFDVLSDTDYLDKAKIKVVKVPMIETNLDNYFTDNDIAIIESRKNKYVIQKIESNNNEIIKLLNIGRKKINE